MVTTRINIVWKYYTKGFLSVINGSIYFLTLHCQSSCEVFRLLNSFSTGSWVNKIFIEKGDSLKVKSKSR